MVTEILRVLLQIGLVLLQGHGSRPGIGVVIEVVGEPGASVDMLDARHPSGMIGLVVLRRQGLQDEGLGDQAVRRRESFGNEVRQHGHLLAALPKHSGFHGRFELPMMTLTAASGQPARRYVVWARLCPRLVLQPQFFWFGVSAVGPPNPQVYRLPSRQQLTELLDCRQLAGTDLIVLAVRGFGDPLSDGDEPFVHLGALIRR
jgi:hypothetical protein